MKQWLRIPNETSTAYGHFQYYLLLGKERDHTKVAKESETSVQNIRQLSVKYNWTERVSAYESHMMDAVVGEWEKQARKINTGHLNVANFIFGKIANKFKEVKFQDLTIAEATRLWEVSVKVGRDATGIPDVIAHEVATPEMKDRIFLVMDDEEANIKRIEKFEKKIGANGSTDDSDKSLQEKRGE